jgi:hypothetical protein
MTRDSANDSTRKDGNKGKMLVGVAIAAIAAAMVLGTTTMYQTFAAKPTTAALDDPTQGYNIHVEVGRHDSANLEAHMDHYCKLDTRIVAVCQLYAKDNTVNPETGPQLSQIEFIISDEQYLQLPLRERANWHNHAVELTPERGSPSCISLPEGFTCEQLVSILTGTYGKVITVWDPADAVPNYPPYAFMVDSPFALGQDTNDHLHEEWEVGNDDEDSSADDLPNCGIKQAGPCHPEPHGHEE